MKGTALSGVAPEQWAVLTGILKRHVPTERVCAFGSRVSGKARQYSDLDLVVMTRQPLPLATQAELREAFSESVLPWKVDILDWATLAPEFRRVIKADLLTIQAGSRH